MINDNNLIWMDLEFTGLSDDQVIIETACIVTDKNLEIIEEGPNIVLDNIVRTDMTPEHLRSLINSLSDLSHLGIS